MTFAQRVGSERNLTALYLLTVADIRGTSPKVWNAWKGKLLEDTYRMTLQILGGRTPDADSEVAQCQRDAQAMLPSTEKIRTHTHAWWGGLDVSYFMRHEPADVAWHAEQLAAHTGIDQPLVFARASKTGEGLQVLVYSPDQIDLFARICGYFDQAGFAVLDAKIHTNINTNTKNIRTHALDTFQIHSIHASETTATLVELVQTELVQVLKTPMPLPAPTKGRVSRRVKNFPFTPRIQLNPDEKAQKWLLNVSASDKKGLLYGIARVLAHHKIEVQLAKISTLGERVDDSFLIKGDALNHSKTQIDIETALLAIVSN